MTRMDDIKGRMEAATEGPWRAGLQWTPGAGVGVLSAKSRHDNEDVFASCCDHGAEPTDAQFIAHARQDIPWLVERIEAVRSLVPAYLDDDWEDDWARGYNSAWREVLKALDGEA